MCPAVHLLPGEVRAHCSPLTGLIDIGGYPDGIDDTVDAIVAALSESTFSSIAQAKIMRWKWAKPLLNLGNAIEAICGPPAISDRGREDGRLRELEDDDRSSHEGQSEDQPERAPAQNRLGWKGRLAARCGTPVCSTHVRFATPKRWLVMRPVNAGGDRQPSAAYIKASTVPAHGRTGIVSHPQTVARREGCREREESMFADPFQTGLFGNE